MSLEETAAAAEAERRSAEEKTSTSFFPKCLRCLGISSVSISLEVLSCLFPLSAASKEKLDGGEKAPAAEQQTTSPFPPFFLGEKINEVLKSFFFPFFYSHCAPPPPFSPSFLRYPSHNAAKCILPQSKAGKKEQKSPKENWSFLFLRDSNLRAVEIKDTEICCCNELPFKGLYFKGI